MKVIILKTIEDEKVLDKIFDAALKHKGSDAYNLIRYVEGLVTVYADKVEVGSDKPKAVEEVVEIKQPKQVKKPKK